METWDFYRGYEYDLQHGIPIFKKQKYHVIK